MNTHCPVCNKPVDPATAPTSTYQDVTYYLRCPRCKARFDADPERYLANPGSGAEAGMAGGGLQIIKLERRAK